MLTYLLIRVFLVNAEAMLVLKLEGPEHNLKVEYKLAQKCL